MNLLLNEKNNYYRLVYVLALVTIGYNIIEGCVSIFFGMEDETLSLFGFGLDSFVEVISGIGIWHMLHRLMRSERPNPDRFERQALYVTGSAFYLLCLGLLFSSVINLLRGHVPETTLWGIIVAGISIVTMGFLIYYKRKAGKKLDSAAILADANCTKTCLYLSIVLLVSSVAYEVTGIGWIDSVGALFIAGFSFREGREAFEKARGRMCSCHSCH